MNHGAAIAPPNPSRNLQRLPQATNPSGEADAAHNDAFDYCEKIPIRPIPPPMNKVG